MWLCTPARPYMETLTEHSLRAQPPDDRPSFTKKMGLREAKWRVRVLAADAAV